MNVEKIFDALHEDKQNSVLGIICSELERQDYSVTINGQKVTSAGFFNGRHSGLEKQKGPFNVTLRKGNSTEQEFDIDFIDYHEVAIKRVS